jgi:hypothetical protein
MLRPNPCWVYFARRADGQGPVKIGCSEHPIYRIRAILPGHRCELLATVPGAEALERQFHARFADSWEWGEWFRWSDDLAAVIGAVAAGTFDLESLPPGRFVKHPNRKGQKWPPGQREALQATWAAKRAWAAASGAA